MEMLGLSSGQRRFFRLISIAIALSVAVAMVLLLIPWIGVLVTPAVLRRGTIGFLVGLEIAYVVALAGLVAGGVTCGALIRRVRGMGQTGERPRGLLLCACSLMSIGMAELATGLRHSWIERAERSAAADPALPERFAEAPREPDVTIAVVGESSAFGMPFESWLSIGKIVAWGLERANPGQKVHLETVAEPGDTLKGQYLKLARVTRPGRARRLLRPQRVRRRHPLDAEGGSLP